MKRRLALRSLAVAAVGSIGLAAAPVALASAGAVTPARSAAAARPPAALAPLNRSPFCTEAHRTASSTSGTKIESAIESAIQSGNWAKGKVALLAALGQASKAEGLLKDALSGAPGKVRTAGAVMLGFVAQEKSIVAHSTSLQNFSTTFEHVAESAKLQAAEKVLVKYEHQLCGTPLPPSF